MHEMSGGIAGWDSEQGRLADEERIDWLNQEMYRLGNRVRRAEDFGDTTTAGELRDRIDAFELERIHLGLARFIEPDL